MVSINELADMIASIAGVRVNRRHAPGSQVVRGARDIVGGRAQAHLFVGRATSPGTRVGVQFWDSDLSAPAKQGLLGEA